MNITNYALRWCQNQTPYAGSVTRGETVTEAMTKPDASSIYRLNAENLAKGPVQLRPPLCKCTGGRLICAGVYQKMKDIDVSDSTVTTPQESSPLPVEPWKPTDEPFDVQSLLKTESEPLHYTQPIYFWIQNLDPHSFSFLMGHALVGKEFIVASLRCFVRVNGVRVRVLDTKFILREAEVLRERSWKEVSKKLTKQYLLLIIMMS